MGIMLLVESKQDERSGEMVLVLGDRCISLRLKENFYKRAIRSAMLYGTYCWAVKKHYISKMNVAEMRMLR